MPHADRLSASEATTDRRRNAIAPGLIETDTTKDFDADIDLMIWDILSHLGFRELLRDAYFHGTSGILAVTDMTRRSTLEDLDAWISGVENVAGRIPVVVIGANSDKRDQIQVSEEEVSRVAMAHGAPVFFLSGGSGDAMEAAFRLLAERMVAARCRE